MRIATFNANSIRQRLGIVLDWLEAEQPDVLGIQETKVVDEQFPAAAFEDAGWHVAYRGEKSYNGVAMVTKEEPEAVEFGLQDDNGESETRLAYALVGGVHVINTYVPQGNKLDSEKFAFKLEWYQRLATYFEEQFQDPENDIAWIGDLNVAPTAADVHNSKKIWPHVCHCQEVIDAFEATCGFGFEDVFRRYLPDPGTFTYFDYRTLNALDNNIGWRIDHILATPPLYARATDCRVDLEPRRREKPSDHTFVVADFADA